jgi:hypothetical protein
MPKIAIEAEDVRQLGPLGPGYLALPDAIDEALLDKLQHELGAEDIPWRTQDGDVQTQRGRLVTQSFDYFAHKISAGEQTFLEQSPGFQGLRQLIMDTVINPLSIYFPSLTTWQPDEMVAQRYRAETGHIDWHFDRARYFGLIVIANTLETATVGVADARDHYDRAEFMREGGILVLRASRLFSSRKKLTTEHAVLQAGDGRTSVTLRANSRPQEPMDGIIYHNWQG